MQKRYVAEVADGFRDESGKVDVVRVPAGETTQLYGKTFQLTRRWDYRRVDQPASDGLLTEDQLNSLGADGWELAGVVADADGVHYFLKRVRGG